MTEIEDFSIKNYNSLLQRAEPRSISAQKPGPTQVLNLPSKSPDRQMTTASRLVQKRKSVERKIEEKRKQKIEAELKEVQSKPRISSRSRKLAEKAEIKVLNVKKPRESTPNQLVFEDDIIEIEKDIQLLENCLNLNEKRIQIQTFEEQKFSMFESLNNEPPKRENSGGRVKVGERKSEQPALNKKSMKPPSHSVKRGSANPVKIVTIPTQRKFLKSSSPTIGKCRSSSMENLASFQFAYRSLSPYQVAIKRTGES